MMILIAMTFLVHSSRSGATALSMSKTAIPIVRRNCISPVEIHNLWGREVFVKRDDLLLSPGPTNLICGNKVRKFKALVELTSKPRMVISCGGSQSNAMGALAAICNSLGIQFLYVTPPIARSLIKNPRGNFETAIQKGMQFVEINQSKFNFRNHESIDYVRSAIIANSNIEATQIDSSTSIFIPQGGACDLGISGINDLCSELESFILPIFHTDKKKWKIVFASGTGTMSLFSSRFFRESSLLSSAVEVINVPCATSSATMLDELKRLDFNTGAVGVLPKVLDVPLKPYFRFGSINSLHFKIWKDLFARNKLLFDLVYAPRAFELLLRKAGNIDFETDATEWSLKSLFPHHHLMYYHCGGIEGNESQLARYTRGGFK